MEEIEERRERHTIVRVRGASSVPHAGAGRRIRPEGPGRESNQ